MEGREIKDGGKNELEANDGVKYQISHAQKERVGRIILCNIRDFEKLNNSDPVFAVLIIIIVQL